MIAVVYAIAVFIALVAVLAKICFDGTTVDDNDWRKVLIARADEQHAAIMRGDLHLGVYGKYPPADLT